MSYTTFIVHQHLDELQICARSSERIAGEGYIAVYLGSASVSYGFASSARNSFVDDGKICSEKSGDSASDEKVKRNTNHDINGKQPAFKDGVLWLQ